MHDLVRSNPLTSPVLCMGSYMLDTGAGAGAAASSGPGFWSGMLGGGLLGYMFGR